MTNDEILAWAWDIAPIVALAAQAPLVVVGLRRLELDQSVFVQVPAAPRALCGSLEDDVLRHGRISIGDAVEDALERDFRVARAPVAPDDETTSLAQHPGIDQDDAEILRRWGCRPGLQHRPADHRCNRVVDSLCCGAIVKETPVHPRNRGVDGPV